MSSKSPLNRIKIGRSFVNELVDNKDATAIVKAIIALDCSLEVRTTAEGVGTLEQLRYLRGEGCDEMQGYYFSRPVPIDQFNDPLQEKTITSIFLTRTSLGFC
ncbi:MAG: EAL domain-containing protein [Geminicoccaceae bacterium]